MTTTLIDLIRHGEPEGGPMFRGQTDHPLSATGWQQMRGAIGDGEHWDETRAYFEAAWPRVIAALRAAAEK